MGGRGGSRSAAPDPMADAYNMGLGEPSETPPSPRFPWLLLGALVILAVWLV